MHRSLAALWLGLALTACGSPGPTTRAQDDIVAEAMRAFDRSEWALAGRLLREAASKRPGDLRVRYSLAVTATHLELRDEAIREFRWVLANAPGSPEAQAARNWLLAAGALSVGESTAPAPPSAGPADVVAKDPDRGNSFVRGHVSWNDGTPPMSLTRLQLFLKGLDNTPTKDFFMVTRTDEQGRFEFKNVPAGTYRLTNRVAGDPLWRLRVSVGTGQATSLELTAQNSFRARDDFPDAK